MNQANTGFMGFVAEIADYLGWKIVPSDGYYDNACIQGSLVLDEDCSPPQLYLRGRGGRVEVSGRFPRSGSGWALPYGTEAPRITAAMSRGARAVALDIKRRFIPEYLILYREAVDRCSAANKRAKETERTMRMLAEAFETTLRQANDLTVHFRFPNDIWGDVRMSGGKDKLNLKLCSVPQSLAVKIAELLKG